MSKFLIWNNLQEMDGAKYLAAQFAPSVAHSAVESAVDAMIKRNEEASIGAG